MLGFDASVGHDLKTGSASGLFAGGMADAISVQRVFVVNWPGSGMDLGGSGGCFGAGLCSRRPHSCDQRRIAPD